MPDLPDPAAAPPRDRRAASDGSLLTDYRPPAPQRERYGRHAALALATFASMVWAGATLAPLNLRYGAAPATESTWTLLWALFHEPEFWRAGLLYAVPFFTFLTVHEFGHYVAARKHRLRVSLPYYIPIPLSQSLGTFGAVIRIREPFRRMTQLFDVGAAGPLAGAVVALATALGAVLTLPGTDYLLGVSGHEGVVATLQATGAFTPFDREAVAPGTFALVLGDTPLFHLLGSLGAYRVPGDEIAHFPVLLAGWLGLFFTALNLLPVGQLDGGHVVYALFGPRVHGIVARVATLLLLLSGSVGFALDLVPGLGTLTALGEAGGWLVLLAIVAVAVARLFDGEWRVVVPAVASVMALVALLVVGTPGLAAEVGYTGWLLWIGLILFLIRVDHPPVLINDPLSPRQRALGYACLALFGLCFSIQPLQVVSG